jgi:hypothetical protein
MDSRFFRLTTNPNYYSNEPSNNDRRKQALRYTNTHDTAPTQDSRFPGWAGPMADGRLVTDYRPHCSTNIPSNKQFGTKEWLQKNTDDIIAVSRERQAKAAGASYGFDTTVVPPPAQIVQCKATECSFMTTGLKNGIGTERPYDKAPELFGSFTVPRQRNPNPPNISITTNAEGGINSPRGRTFSRLGNKSVSGNP